MRWLIVEDALRDRKGHWYEWVATFYHGLRELGDQVSVLADSTVAPDIRDALRANPILPASIWHRMGDGAGPIIRYGRVVSHGWQTWRVMRQYLAQAAEFDVIFVPTIMVHHLLAWAWLLKRVLRRKRTRVLLFFLTAPIRIDSATGKAVFDGSPSGRLLLRLLKWIEPEIREGKVILGVETRAMQERMEELTGVPFTCFPQPVSSLPAPEDNQNDPDEIIEMACYGAARAEKGSDILQEAIGLFRRRFPASRVRFMLQWIDDFTVEGGLVTKAPELLGDPQVCFLTRYFAGEEYPEHLKRTRVMLLPYRVSSYGLRGSRVVIEAVVNGIPVIATAATTLATLADEFGAGIWCDDGNAESLAAAIQEMERRFLELRRRAAAKQAAAAAHFSVATFRDLVCGPSRKAGSNGSGFSRFATPRAEACGRLA
jgi:glycosyltransferase involved in cell wall biosynthesis